MICQSNCGEEVNIFTHNSKSSFLNSDELCNKFIDLWIKYKLVISKWFTTEVAVSRTLPSITLPSMSTENVVQRAPTRTVLPLLF
jgi:hypothetical protein